MLSGQGVPGVGHLGVAVLSVREWSALAHAHAVRADELTAGHRERRRTGTSHPIEDFLYTYYSLSPSRLRRWHPGVRTHLASEPGNAPPHAAWRWYASAESRSAGPTSSEHRFGQNGAGAIVGLDVARFLADRRESVIFVRDLLRATAARPPFTGCYGLHEWAMVYRQAEHRHALPLRLGQAGTDAVVEDHQVRCSHVDAFRFFTPAARPLNRQQPTRATQIDHEQPGCLHATMDLYKWAYKLGPATPGDLLLDCLALARDARLLDMQASPYDVSGLGQPAVPIETADGKAEYARRQRGLAERASGLRARLLRVCGALLEEAGTAPGEHARGRESTAARPADVV